MSKKPKPILGPDGKPLDVAKYRPASKTTHLTIDGKAVAAEHITFTFRSVFDPGLGYSIGHTPTVKGTEGKPRKTTKGVTLAAAVERDLIAATKDLPKTWRATAPEMPKPPVDDTYASSFESARKNCQHPNSTGTMHAYGERQCDDCGTYFKRNGWWD